ncbi:sensor histidine kinase [Microvirga solisilvae]|uniref:sensor histidine kinase n=1 Tax=Microvirga solisilvae TaxID=2919498 RepID=UPI001FAFE417|nr:PAS domain-containing sensor histidine kinase [Microvirga solisilvae]
MVERIRAFDWAATPLGPIETWPAELKSAAGLVLESGFPAALVWGPSLVTIYNDAFRPILGAKPEALGRSFADVWSEIWHEIGPLVENAFAGQATFIEDYPLVINRRGEPEQTYFTFSYSPVRAADGTILGMIDTVMETTDKMQVARRQIEEALRESEERYRTLFNSMDEAYAVVEVIRDDAGQWSDFLFLEVNPAFMVHTGMPYPVGRTAAQILKTPNPRWAEIYGRVAETGQSIRIEETEWTLGRVFDLNIFRLGGPESQRVAVLFTNITQRKQAEEALRDSERHAQLLLAELQHRVRNTLGVIRSIARRTAATSETAEDYAMHLEGRIDAFARVQAAVTRDPEAGLDLEMLVADELRAVAAHEGDQVKSISGPEIRLRAKSAETLALAIHELGTNAVKYGALSSERGRIQVKWAVGRRGDDPQLVFEWIETGVSLSNDTPRRRGFGTELIEKVLSYELGGEAVLDFTPDGLCCTMRFPMDDQVFVLGEDRRSYNP